MTSSYNRTRRLEGILSRKLPDIKIQVTDKLVCKCETSVINADGIIMVLTKYSLTIEYKGPTLRFHNIDRGINEAVRLLKEKRVLEFKKSYNRMKRLLDDAIERQNIHLNNLRLSLTDCTDKHTTDDVPDDMECKFRYLADLQQRCHELLSTHMEYQPGSENVKSLGEEFNKLKVVGKLE